VRFPSNWNLSQERAEVVQRLLAARLATPGRVRAEGRADTEPVAPNDTPDNMARNRRVEVMLLVPPPERDQDLQVARTPPAPVPGTGTAAPGAPARR
jgi:type VI secretion system protein ImpK